MFFYSLGARKKLVSRNIILFYSGIRKAGLLIFFTVASTAQISANIRYKQVYVDNNFTNESSPCSYCPMLLSHGHQLHTARTSLGGEERRKKVRIPIITDYSGNWVFGGW